MVLSVFVSDDIVLTRNILFLVLVVFTLKNKFKLGLTGGLGGGLFSGG